MRENIKRQDGNVLFIILIAVALFAALSYAVTSSTRTSGGDVSNETNLLKAAQMVQDCAVLRQQTERFLFSGVSAAQMQMNISGDPTQPCRTGAQCLFSTTGGNAIIPIPPQIKGNKGAMPPAQMAYEFYAVSDGMYLPGYSSNKPLVMFMAQNLGYEFCKKVNLKLGLPEEPEAENTTHPTLRDECVVAISQFTFRCPLTR